MKIPKIWDYAYVRYKDADNYKIYYEYIDEIPNYNNLESENRENDIFILLQDLDQYLRMVNISDSIFNHLNLQRIRDARTNTDAINEYFHQNPIMDCDGSDHIIMHTFSTNI